MRPKTIFLKLLTAYVLSLLVCLMISIGMLYIFLSGFLADEKVKLLRQNGDRIKVFLDYYVENGTGPILYNFIENVISSYGSNTNSVIWVASPEGKIIFLSKNTLPGTVRDKFTQDGLNLSLPDERQYKEVNKAEGQVETGDFYGLFGGTGVSWITLIMPYYHETVGESRYLGAVYISTQLPELNQAQIQLHKYFIIAFSISALLTGIVIYFLSLRISKPLTNLKNAAKSIAGGNFDYKLKDSRDDEIGELITSFNEMAGDLKSLDAARKGFIANISHELRTPLTSIGGFVDGMLDGTIPPEKFENYLRIVSEETKRLNRLANDTLELAKLDARAVSLNQTCFDINELLRRTILKLEGSFGAKDLQIEVELSEEELIVYADKDSIERVCMNLLHNAFKFTPEGGSIKIGTNRKNDKALVCIEDTGEGISEENRAQIWERFYKVAQSGNNLKEGVGLGLSIVKNIISLHGEEIWVDSKMGMGSKFTFTLPLGDKEKIF